MHRSKKIFIFLAVLFLLLLAYIAYDFSRKTRFPGALKTLPDDTVVIDTISVQAK